MIPAVVSWLSDPRGKTGRSKRKAEVTFTVFGVWDVWLFEGFRSGQGQHKSLEKAEALALDDWNSKGP